MVFTGVESISLPKDLGELSIVEPDEKELNITHNDIKSRNSGLFSIEREIIELLNNNDCYSPFENKIISYR